MDFNLIDERWIPCVGKDGKREEVSIREVLSRAHELAAIRDPSPLVTAALHRLLLAVLHAALRGPKDHDEWAALYGGGRLDLPAVAKYLDRWRGRFNLFDNARPFYQVAGFNLPEALPAAQLAHETAGGNNPSLFDHTTDSRPPALPFAACARLLVANQAFALGGGVGPTSSMFGKHPNRTHAPCVGGVMALLQGDSLFATLMLNLLVYTRASPFDQDPAADRPAWERDDPIRPGPRVPTGYLDLLTWQSRCIRLVPDVGGVCWMHYAQGEVLDARPREPAWFYRLDRNNEPTPVRLNPERALWRNADSLFAFSASDTASERRPVAFRQVATLYRRGVLAGRERRRCALFALANDQAKVLLWAHEDLPVPPALLEDEETVNRLRAALERCEEAGRALRDALQDLARGLLVFAPAAAGGRKPDRKAVQDVAESLQGERLFWASLELPFKRFLADLPARGEAGVRDWLEEVCVTARRAFHRAAENSMGLGARELKARVEAERYLNARLHAIQQQVPEPQGGDA
ncbi:MAG: type I-E CRISPR-associated protein Cse1/CasA [Planctomycetes bacterium]|nr:type I-E CRISPR-associated protein Cse1/CasA [Planctomycetota bacterium]